ncbi:MAG: PIG-L family deacetylase [Ginsengibacter sp.]
MSKSLWLVLFSFLFFNGYSQSPKTYSSSQIFEQIKKLDVLGTVLYIAAHPDDENTRLLAFLANGKLYRTGYLSITRGDGGQNLIGDEQGPELGLIRTQELLAARRIDGAEQFFTRAYDFGYTKSPAETFTFWDKQKILSDVVWVIRKFKPDVIVTRFPTTGEGGHGHHTASAILAGEAFDAAADPTKFPEQFKYGVKPWKVKRLLWNTFNFGDRNTTNNNQFKIDVGGYNPLLGKSYGEIASESRSQHKSQGFGVPASRGSSLEYFTTIKGEAPSHLLMDGVPTDWERLNRKDIHVAIQAAIKNYSFQYPENSLPALLKIYADIKRSGDPYWREQKLSEIKNVIQQCAGIYMEATTNTMYAVQGDSLPINFTINNRLPNNVSINFVRRNNKEVSINKSLSTNENVRNSFSIWIPADAVITQPYWLVNPMTAGAYTVNNQELIGKPWNDPQSVEVSLNIGSEKFEYLIPIQYKSNDPVKGEEYQPLTILPTVEISATPSLLLSVNGKPEPVSFSTKSNISEKDIFTINRKFSGNVIENKSDNTYYYSLKKDAVNKPENIVASVNSNGYVFDSHKEVIQYDHIPTIVYFQNAVTKIVSVDLAISGKKAGYIPGAGDKIPEALEKMGYVVTTLSSNDITNENLKQFDVIVTGVRAYNIHEWLNDKYNVLMKYVNDGGVLLVQYNTNNNIGPVKAHIGPFPFTISRTRVTDENAQVQFLDPANSLLNFPNKIVPNDFMNWIQERSTYHASAYENNYKTLFAMNDEGEKEDAGSLIYTNYGKGRFVYSGLVFFRELPAGVPGAYRLFANLLAKPNNE